MKETGIKQDNIREKINCRYCFEKDWLEQSRTECEKEVNVCDELEKLIRKGIKKNY